MSRPTWPIQIIWPGKTAVILAGGPSLSCKEFRYVARATLDGRCKTIAVNDAIFLAWWADWLHGCDIKWWMWHRESVTKFTGIKTTLTETVPLAWGVNFLGNASHGDENRGGYTDKPDVLHAGGNGGFQAIQCAMKAGATRILLLGFDMKGTHWFGEHPDRIQSDHAGTMLPWFDTLVEPARQRGIEIINCTPGSLIECFPRARVQDIL